MALTMLLKPIWQVADYIINYDYIVNVLCENRDKPQLNCDSKCYLAKQLAKELEDDGKNPFELRQVTVEQVHPIYYQSLVSFEFGTILSFFKKSYWLFQNLVFLTLYF